MIEATLVKSTNLLKVLYTGHIKPEEAKNAAQDIEKLLGEVESGFLLLTDMRSLETMDLGCVPFIEQVMDACNDRGIALVVRIIPDPHKDIGLNILSLFHYRRGVRIVTCQKLEEAERALAGPTAQERQSAKATKQS
jgi:hypothetical protein